MDAEAEEFVALAIVSACGARDGGWDAGAVREELKSSAVVSSELAAFFRGA
jgi:hypothetical protein